MSVELFCDILRGKSAWSSSSSSSSLFLFLPQEGEGCVCIQKSIALCLVCNKRIPALDPEDGISRCNLVSHSDENCERIGAMRKNRNARS